jgi:hypothetical protein
MIELPGPVSVYVHFIIKHVVEEKQAFTEEEMLAMGVTRRKHRRTKGG